MIIRCRTCARGYSEGPCQGSPETGTCRCSQCWTGHSIDLASRALITAKFAPYADFQVFPVLDAEPAVAVMHEAAQFRDSIT